MATPSKQTVESLFNSFLDWYFATLIKGEIKDMNSHNIKWFVSLFMALDLELLQSGYDFMKIEASLVKNCRKLI